MSIPISQFIPPPPSQYYFYGVFFKRWVGFHSFFYLANLYYQIISEIRVAIAFDYLYTLIYTPEVLYYGVLPPAPFKFIA